MCRVWLNWMGSRPAAGIMHKLPRCMQNTRPIWFLHILYSVALLCLLAPRLYAQEDAPADSTAFTLDGYVLGPGEDPAAKIDKNLFLKTVVSRSSCYEGESIVAEYYLYTRLSIDARVGRRTGFDGFSTIELPPTIPAGSHVYRWHGGRVFKVYALRRVQLTPLRTGALQLATARVEALVTFFRKSAQAEPEDESTFLPGNRVTRAVQLSQEPQTIAVRPLPSAGRPDQSITPVGSFTLAARHQRQQQGGALQYLEVTITGAGQWAQVQCPFIDWPAGLKPVETVVADQLDSQHVPVSGSRTYRIAFESLQPGSFSIPPMSLVFFDPEAGQYKTARSEAVTLSVRAANAASGTTPDAAAASPAVATDPAMLFTRWAPALFAVLALLLAVSWWLLSRRRPSTPAAPAANAAWDQPDSSVVRKTRRMHAGSGTMLNQESAHTENAIPEAAMLARQYRQVILDNLEQMLGGRSHPRDPLYLRLRQYPLPENQIHRIVAFLEWCDRYAQQEMGATETDAEALSQECYAILRMLRQAGG